MSLVKLPIILASCIAVHVSTTAPHDAARQEIIAQSFREKVLLHGLAAITNSIKGGIWAVGLAQTATVIAPHIPFERLPAALSVVKALGGPDNSSITPAFLFGSALIISGGILRWSCYRTMGRLFTFEMSLRPGHRLVQSGPYSVVRHPSYLGSVMYMVGVFIVHGARGSWLRQSGVLQSTAVKGLIGAWVLNVLNLGVSLVKRAPVEDALMKKEFGGEWNEYASRVRYRLIPGIY
ncbi:hypothetical protein BV22DRAFT_1033772 [Leucogyrophana mollusca]|uniref:Uncharacterized protein n=1 Tax=Leucogyrophana mollusca TaxID=85980 RepID=A0ACB8BJA6_9AGAM|nr:hypothetical protein BV22DRAFT_1033772 [Leucogyrophana mollusca]